MMRWSCLGIVLALFSSAYGEKNMAELHTRSNAERAVALCVSEYVRLSGKVFFEEVDRAYVHVSSGRFGVLFARGEVGTFGERSQGYRAYLSCGVLDAGGLSIYNMHSPMTVPLVEKPESNVIDRDFYEGDVIELLYMKSGDRFSLVAVQDFSVPDLNLPSRLD